MPKFYTGVGARKTPQDVLDLMSRIAFRLAQAGWKLRSGGAEGADLAFEVGSAGRCEVFRAQDATDEAMAIAARFHPAWSRCGGYVKRLHGRNAFQVLGRDLKTPSSFLLCWTPDGVIDHEHRTVTTGGTGTAISIASAYGVPVFNLARPDHRKRIETWLNSPY